MANKSLRLTVFTKVSSEKWKAVPQSIKDLYNKLLNTVLLEQVRLMKEGASEGVLFRILNHKGGSDTSKKELIEYLKRKTNFPKDLVDPEYDHIVPTPYQSEVPAK